MYFALFQAEFQPHASYRAHAFCSSHYIGSLTLPHTTAGFLYLNYITFVVCLQSLIIFKHINHPQSFKFLSQSTNLLILKQSSTNFNYRDTLEHLSVQLARISKIAM